MIKKPYSKVILLLALACVTPPLFPVTLSPEDPVSIVSDGTVDQGVTVAGNSLGFVAGWQKSGLLAAASFSSNGGQTWSAPVTFEVNDSAFGHTTVAAQSSKFVLGWTEHKDGTNDSYLYTTVSSNGTSWGVPLLIQTQAASNGICFYAPIAATDAGFMVLWTERTFVNGFREAKASFSADGSSWDPPVLVSAMGVSPDTDEISIADNAAGFLATYTLTASPAGGYARFSSDNGMSWSAPVAVTTVEGGTLLAVGANASGFLAAWVNSTTQMISTSFSTDNGATWSTPVSIPMSGSDATTFVQVSSNNNFFIVTWTDASNNGQASVTEDNGASWSTPVSFPAVATSFVGKLLGVSAVSATEIMFTWRDGSNDAFSSFSGIRPGETSSSSGTFFRRNTPNNPGRTFFD